MSVEAHKETLEFQTEVRQLLHLMIHSLYSNKEIFLRELISNASDACDKLRFEALTDGALYESDPDLKIRVDVDRSHRTITVTDNGIGMSRGEVVENLGTIAKSGTRQFFEALTGDQAKDVKLIGQFGVGFYSAFIVADRVTVVTRRAGIGAAHGVIWESTGEGTYFLEATEKADRGTQIILHLRDDAEEFLDDFRLRSIIRKYSDHISLPVEMPSADSDKSGEYESVNSASALWARPKKEVSDDEYKAFYKHVGHDYEDPLAWTHNHVEGNQSYSSLLYIPRRAPFDLWDRDSRHGIKLYVRRVFIMDDAEHLMPHYLRFVRGVVDSDDLPLNVSREILQHNKYIDSIRSASVRKVLGLLEDLAEHEPARYASFWAEFGRVLKEGPAEDFGNKVRVAKLLRFASTHADSPTPSVSLADYVGRLADGQSKIYYIAADSYAAASKSPHLEVFRKRGIEVLLLWDRVDEWMMSHLTEFDGRQIVSVAKGDLDIGEIGADEQDDKHAEADLKPLLARMQDALGGKVKEVRFSHRLTTSPACLVLEVQDMALHLQRMLKQAGHEIPVSKPVLELNPKHALVRQLESETDDQKFSDWSHVLFEQAMLSEGGQLEDPAGYVGRLNGLLTSMIGKA